MPPLRLTDLRGGITNDLWLGVAASDSDISAVVVEHRRVWNVKSESKQEQRRKTRRERGKRRERDNKIYLSGFIRNIFKGNFQAVFNGKNVLMYLLKKH